MRNGLLAWFNFVCLVFVAHAHILAEPMAYGTKRIDRLVIPLFSLMAGFSWGTLLKKTHAVGFYHGLKMFLYPYLFWSLVYCVLNCVILDVFIRHQAFDLTIGDAVYYAISGYSALHLWFLITLVYVATFYALTFRAISKKGVFVGIAGLLILLSLIVPDLKILSGDNRYLEYLRTWLFWMTPGFSIGIVFSIPKAKTFTAPKLKWASIVLFIVTLPILFWGRGRGFELPAATALFLIALTWPSIYAPKWLTATAPYIMGIYLVHALFTSAFNVALGLGPDHLLPAYFAWPAAICIFFASWFAVWMMRKIPIVRNLV